MQYLEFEFDTEEELREVVDRLWEGMGVTGEISIRPVGKKWRLDVVSEKDLRDSTLEKFREYRIESGD